MTKRLRWTFLAIVVILTSCGGGGGGTADEGGNSPSAAQPVEPMPTSPTTPVFTANSVKVGLDPALPATVAIDRISSSRVSGAVGSEVFLPSEKTADGALIMGLNARGEAVLLAFTSGDVNLSVNSTAVALARIALGGRATGTTVGTLEETIRKASSFNTLVQKVAVQSAQGGALQDIPAITDAVWAVARQALIALDATAVARNKPINSSSLPYYFFENGATEKLWVEGSGDTLVVHNRTRLNWKVKSPSGEASTIDGLATPYLYSLVGYYGGSEGLKHVNVVRPASSILLSQDKDTLTTNVLALTTKFTFTVIDIAFKVGEDGSAMQKCAIAMADQLLTGKLEALANQDTGAGALEYLRSLIPSSVAAVFDLVSKTIPLCAGGIEPIDFAVENFYKNTFAIAKILLLLPSVEAVGEGAYQVSTYWKALFPLEICYINGIISPCIEQPVDGFWQGTASISNCSEQGACNFLTYNLGRSGGATLAFRAGSESLNMRVDQEFGCIGATSSISGAVGSTFSYALSSGPPFSNQPSSALTYTVTSASATAMSGTLAVRFDRAGYNGQQGQGTASGTWSVTKRSTSFPKCLPPASGLPLTFNTPSFFCTNLSNEYGCSFSNVNSAGRIGEWLTGP